MPAFVIRGQVYGQPVAAVWDDGAVSLSEALQLAVDRLEATTLDATPTGPGFPPGLDGWEQAYVTVRAALEAAGGRVSREEGDVPTWPVGAGDRA